jgi:hypothetical protein
MLYCWFKEKLSFFAFNVFLRTPLMWRHVLVLWTNSVTVFGVVRMTVQKSFWNQNICRDNFYRSTGYTRDKLPDEFVIYEKFQLQRSYRKLADFTAGHWGRDRGGGTSDTASQCICIRERGGGRGTGSISNLNFGRSVWYQWCVLGPHCSYGIHGHTVVWCYWTTLSPSQPPSSARTIPWKVIINEDNQISQYVPIHRVSSTVQLLKVIEWQFRESEEKNIEFSFICKNDRNLALLLFKSLNQFNIELSAEHRIGIRR